MNSSIDNIDTSTLEEAVQKSWGKMTLQQLLTSLIILLVCLIVVKLIMTLLRRLTGRSKMDERVRIKRRILDNVRYTKPLCCTNPGRSARIGVFFFHHFV